MLIKWHILSSKYKRQIKLCHWLLYGRSKYRKGGQYIVTIFWPRGQNIVGVKISSHTGRHNECCAGSQYQPRQCRPYKRSISVLPRSQFYKKQGKLAFSTSCTTVHPHWHLRNDAWWRDSQWRHNRYVTSQSTGQEPWAQRQTLVFTPKVA